MTNVVPLFPSCSTAPAPAIRPRAPAVSVVVRPTVNCGKRLALADIGVGHYTCTLTCGDWSIELQSGHLAGLVAFVLGAATMRYTSPSFPEKTFSLGRSHGRYSLPPELMSLSASLSGSGTRFERARRQETLFAEQAAMALRHSRDGKRMDKAGRDWWQSKVDKAAQLVPEHLRRVQGLEPAPGYDEQGHALTAAQVQRRAQWQSLVRQVAGDGQELSERRRARLSVLEGFPWDQIAADKDPLAPVLFRTSAAYAAAFRLAKAAGFDRLPESWAQMERLADLVFAVELELYPVAAFPTDKGEWRAAMLSARREFWPETADLFEVLLTGDAAAIAALHAKKDWYKVLEASYSPERDELLRPQS